MVKRVTNPKTAEHLFTGWEETMITSCLENIMGSIYSCGGDESAMALLGDFCFLAGKPCSELLDYKLSVFPGRFSIIIPQTVAWNEVIENYPGCNTVKSSRYAIKKEPDIFNIEKLQTLADTVPGGFEIRPIDRQLFRLCMASRQLRDIVSQFDSYEHFSALGLGYAAVADGLPVSGAGSYSRYSSGIEIEVDTLPGYRRKGLARACCAKLILECLDRGLYPSWDAQNTASAALAESLGYHFDREYTVYIESDK